MPEPTPTVSEMNDEAKYGVLLITGGRTHQEMYALDFAADRRCRLLGVVDEPDIDNDRRAWNADFAQKLGVPLLDDLDAALRREDVDIVSVCSEPERRARVGALAARAGKHVYLDKPLGCRLEQVDELVEAVRLSGVKSHMFSLLRLPWAARARDIVTNGSIGALTALHCDLLFAKGLAQTLPEYRPRQEHFPPTRFTFVDSKREVYTTAIYSLVFIGWLTGRRVVDVRAVTANYFFAEHVRNDVEDFGALLLNLEGGIMATVTAGRIGWTNHRAGGPVQTVLVGSKGSATIDAYRPRLEICSDEPPWLQPRRNPDDPMGFWNSTQDAVGVQPKRDWQVLSDRRAQSDASYFVDCIEQDRESDLPVECAAHATEVILAAYKSAAEQRTIRMPLERPLVSETAS